MSINSSAITLRKEPLSSSHKHHTGRWWGLLGVIAFSFTVPFTKVALHGDHLSALFVGSGRAVIAGILAIIALLWTRQPLPHGRQWVQLAIVATGAVVGFPLFTSYALQVTPASHGAVVIALLPAATAVVAVLRTKEQPGTMFWASALAGAVAAIAFALHGSGSFSRLEWPDLLLFLAVALCAIGYAEGGVLSRSLGSWQTISWALVISLPLMVVLSGLALVHHPPSGGVTTWLAFTYLSVISMFLGFFAWYRGLALGPMSQVSQIQLSQPVMSLLWAWILLGEHITLGTLLGGVVVIACALSAVRARVS